MRKSFLKKATSSFVGRVLRRFLGEEKGAVMMEYIVIGLLIAAAAVIAISAFGQTITQMFASLGASVTGDHATATDVQNTAQSSMKAGATASDAYISNQHSKKSGIAPAAGSWGTSN
jgi:Flp pilus assembly pilin Flp